jgi:hypothetical protein
VSTKKRENVLYRALASIAEYDATIVPTDEPAQFVRQLGFRWKERGGRVAGKPRHTDQYLERLLTWRDTPVRSLTSKLAGKTNLRPEDADALVQVFLSFWHYTGEPSGGESIDERTAGLYRPMLSNDEVVEVASYMKRRIFESGAEGRTEAALPGKDTADLIATEFAKSDALLVVSPRRILVTAQPKQVLIGFRSLMNRLWKIDGSDHKKRILVWIVDLGRQKFDDGFQFWNVQELRSRFKALKLFKEEDTEVRWNWLQSRAVIILRDRHDDAHEDNRQPSFEAYHALFNRIPLDWAGLQQARTLYGANFERLDETTFSIFLKRPVDDRSGDGSSNADGEYELSYFGHAPFVLRGDPRDREMRGLKLPSPGKAYENAFRAVFIASTEILRPNNFGAVDGKLAIEKLRHLGFRLLGLEEFMEDF